MSDVIPTHGPKARRSKKSGFFHFCPTYLYLLVFYIIIALLGGDIRRPLLSFGNYAISWVEILYLLAALFGIFEMLKVSEPNVNNTNEALAILGAAMIYVVLFFMGMSGGTILGITFGIFNNTEFLMLTLISAIQTIAAFILNARTIQLQII